MANESTDCQITENEGGDNNKSQSQKYKKIFRRIGRFKDYLNEMCSLVSNYAVKAAGLRDRNDEVAKCLAKYTKIEEFSTTSKLAMAVTAELVATAGDHQDSAVQRIETVVLPNLSSYGRICECIKADVLNAIAAKSKEARRRKRVERMRKKSDDPKHKSILVEAERELERACAETSRMCQLSQEQVIKFEHKRLMDLKESLGNFIKIQIAMHAKSLELLSEAYKHIQNIDEDADLDILKSALKIGDSQSKKKNAKLKREKSQKSIKSNRNLKTSSTNANQDEKSGKSYGSDTESWHSSILSRVEKVMSSNLMDAGITKESKCQSKEKSSTGKHKKHNFCDEEEAKMSKAKVEYEEDKSYSDSSLQNATKHRLDKQINERGNAQHNRESKHNNYSSLNRRKAKYEDEADSDSYTAATKPKMLNKRPTTPTRPITAPVRMSQTEESSYADDFSFRNKGPRAAVNSNGRKSYYYSQSEEENSRKTQARFVQGKQSNNDIKRVSFQSGVQRKEFSVPKAGFVVKSPTNTRENNTYQYNNSQQPQLFFPPVKSSLKKYC